MQKTIPIELRLTVRKWEAAAELSISVPTINRLLASGELESIKRGKSRLVLVRSLLELVERSKVPTPRKGAASPRAEA